jgi:iron complex outermembrane recepter protein
MTCNWAPTTWTVFLVSVAQFVVFPAPSYGQDRQRSASALEEIIVTATRVPTDLQTTPLSVAVLTGEELEHRGIDAGRDLGIMLPNVVLNSGPAGELFAAIHVRGLPGVTTYVDGVWTDNAGILQRSFVELERVEVLRGPQGTLFGRNTNGGAIQIVTRSPADEFGARFDVQLGDFGRRAGSFAIDVPLSERITTKWTAAYDESDGFIESQSADFAFGAQDNSLARADLVWQPHDKLSLRFNANLENRSGSPARVVRISNFANPAFTGVNVLAGNPDLLAQARAVDPSFPDPPFKLAIDRYTAETHQPGFPGGQVGRWETRSDTDVSTEVDQRFAILKLDWQIGERLSLESSTAFVETDLYQLAEYDGSELDSTTDLRRDDAAWSTQEIHLVGEHFNGRLRSLLGLYYHDFEARIRNQGWWFWEFAVPNSGPGLGTFGPAGVDGRPLVNLAARDYVRAWGATVGNSTVATFMPETFLTHDRLSRAADTDRAFFGQLTIAALDKLDVTLGFRFTTDDGRFTEYLPADAFRSPVPGMETPGDAFAVASVISDVDRFDFGTVSTPKLAVSYELTDDLFLYASYAEGFTSSEIRSPPGLPPIVLDPEVIRTRELGVRSTWFDRQLRVNATAFSSRWEGLRVQKLVPNPNDPSQVSTLSIPTDDGVAAGEGLELELAYAPTDRWQLDFALGLLDTEYLDIGIPAANGTGLQPSIPFAYAPEMSYSLGLRHLLPFTRGGSLAFMGAYGWMDEYQRAPANQFQPKNPDGSNKPEPAYGVLNARVVYEPARGRWQVSAFGTNLTDEWYINGGIDVGFHQGYDFATVGRRRELGVGVRFTLD